MPEERSKFIPSYLLPPPQPEKRQGFIYFMGAEEGDTPIKVGWAGDVAGRLKQVQTGCSFALIVHGFVPGTTENEAWMHQRLAQHRVFGEWFQRQPALAELAYQQQRHQELRDLDAMRQRWIPELLERGLSFAEIGDQVCMTMTSVASWCVRELGMEIDLERMKIQYERKREYEDRLRGRQARSYSDDLLLAAEQLGIDLRQTLSVGRLTPSRAAARAAAPGCWPAQRPSPTRSRRRSERPRLTSPVASRAESA